MRQSQYVGRSLTLAADKVTAERSHLLKPHPHLRHCHRMHRSSPCRQPGQCPACDRWDGEPQISVLTLAFPYPQAVLEAERMIAASAEASAAAAGVAACAVAAAVARLRPCRREQPSWLAADRATATAKSK